VQQVVAELDAQHRQLGVHLAELILLVGRQAGAAADKPAVRVLDHLLLLGREVGLVAGLVDNLDPLEQLRVHAHVVAQGRQERRHLAVDRLELRVRLGRLQAAEHALHARQQLARVVHRLERVGEGRRLGVVRDRLDLLPLLRDALLDGRQEVLGLDVLERRHLERCRPSFEKRVAFRRGCGLRPQGRGQREREPQEQGRPSGHNQLPFHEKRVVNAGLAGRRDAGGLPRRNRRQIGSEELPGREAPNGIYPWARPGVKNSGLLLLEFLNSFSNSAIPPRSLLLAPRSYLCR
jgi:hypothetical protein